MEELVQRLQRIERELQERTRAVEQRLRRAERRGRLQMAAVTAVLAGAILIAPGSRAALAQDLSATLAQLLARVAALETKAQFITVSGDEMFIRGTNLHIENGLGATNGNPNNPFSLSATTVNGKGNLIIGYNALRAGENARSGSHCLILGDRNNYSSYGGIVAGRLNTISAPYASVSGGSFNTASGVAASVSGGGNNTASNFEASVSGGANNMASGLSASVNGGSRNTASGTSAAVSGGGSNTAIGIVAAVSGGERNSATGNFASVSGGQVNNAVANHASISGGQDIRQGNFFGWSAGSEAGGSPTVGNFRSP